MHRRVLSLLFTAILLISAFLGVESMGVTEATSGAYVHDDLHFIYLGNDFLEIQFSKENKGLIYSFVNKLTQRDYRSIKTCQGPAWRVILTNMSSLKMYGTLEEKNFTQFEFSCQNISDGVRLHLRYTECGYENLDITVAISVFDNSSLTFWRVNITCDRSMFTGFIFVRSVTEFTEFSAQRSFFRPVLASRFCLMHHACASST